MVTRRPRVAFICDEEVKEILEEWADEEGRTLSNLVERIVLEVIATKGKTLTHTQAKERKSSNSRPQPPTASKTKTKAQANGNGKGRGKSKQSQAAPTQNL